MYKYSKNAYLCLNLAMELNPIVMEKIDKNLLRSKISEMIIKYEEDVKETEKMTQPVKPENSLGRISRMDAINNKSVMEASLRSKISKLNKLRLALQKLDEPSFGSCVNCGKVIQIGRIMFMPESEKCIRCAK